jgi:hypothetical protein
MGSSASSPGLSLGLARSPSRTKKITTGIIPARNPATPGFTGMLAGM